MELVKKLQELIKDVQKYVEEQAKAHKKVMNLKLHKTLDRCPFGVDICLSSL